MHRDRHGGQSRSLSGCNQYERVSRIATSDGRKKQVTINQCYLKCCFCHHIKTNVVDPRIVNGEGHVAEKKRHHRIRAQQKHERFTGVDTYGRGKGCGGPTEDQNSISDGKTCVAIGAIEDYWKYYEQVLQLEYKIYGTGLLEWDEPSGLGRRFGGPLPSRLRVDSKEYNDGIARLWTLRCIACHRLKSAEMNDHQTLYEYLNSTAEDDSMFELPKESDSKPAAAAEQAPPPAPGTEDGDSKPAAKPKKAVNIVQPKSAGQP